MASPRVALLLALLAFPPSVAGAAPSAEVHVAWRLVPATLPSTAPIATLLHIDGPPGLALQARAWLAEGNGTASRTWDGHAWGRSDRYVIDLRLDEQGHAEPWVFLAPRDAVPGPATLFVRLRAEGTMVAELSHTVDVVAAEEHTVAAPRARALATLRGAELRTLTPVGLDWRDAALLPAPSGIDVRAVSADGTFAPWHEQPREEVRLDRVLPRPANASEGVFASVTNEDDAPVDLAHWSLQSGSSTVQFQGVLAPRATWTVATNASGYHAVTGRDADEAEPGLRMVASDGNLTLRWLGEERDRLAWGRATAPSGSSAAAGASATSAASAASAGPTMPSPRPGVAFVRTTASNGIPSWTERPAGWSTFLPPSAGAVALLPFTSEDALPTALAALAEAHQSIDVEVYTLTSSHLTAALLDALARGVAVRVLVEGSPVGGISDAERARLDRLAASGAVVRTIGGTGEDRYATVHSKFAVLDQATLLLGSENWGDPGFPPDGRGNRGWGVLARSSELARFFEGVWENDADAARADVRAWATADAAPPLHHPTSSLTNPLAEGTMGNVTAFVAPDNALPALLDLIGSANRSLDLEELQFPLAWDASPNPVVEALRAAAARGVHVRVLAEGQDTGNNESAAALNAEPSGKGLTFEVRLSRDVRVHNKAVLADGHLAWVGSANLGPASLRKDREAALLLDGPAVGTFLQAFEADWSLEGPPSPPSRAPVLLLTVPLLALAVVAVHRGRRG